jgi:hypothetical protein
MVKFRQIIARINGIKEPELGLRSTRETIIATTVWVLALLFIALPQGFKTRIGTIGLPNNSTPQQIRKAWGPGDAGSLMDIALTWSKFHHIDPTTQYWVVHYWTPGMSLLEVPLIWIAHLGMPIFWSLLFATVLLWGSIFWLMWKHLSPFTGRLFALVISVMLITSWDFRYFFRDDLFYTEGLSLGLLVLALGIISWAVLASKTRSILFIISGTLIGISILIRHVSDAGLSVFTSAAVFGLFFQYRSALKMVHNSSDKKNKQLRLKRKIVLSNFSLYGPVVAGLTANLVLLPWRFVSRIVFGGPLWLLSSAEGGVGGGAWIPNSKIGIWAFSGMNWACNIDPIKCDSEYRLPQNTHNDAVRLADAILAAIKHPMAYIKFRGHFLQANWIPVGVHSIFSVQIISSLIPVALLAYGLSILVRLKVPWTSAWIWLPFLVMQIGQLLLIQYECRYFIPVRLFALGFCISVLITQRAKKTDIVRP